MTPLFKRNDKTTIAELEEYYSNQKSNRPGKAWFMAFLSLFITVGVIAGLFFGGRLLYRTITDDSTTTITTSDGSVTDETSFGEVASDEDSSVIGDESTDDTASSQGVVSDEAAVTTRDIAGAQTENTTDTEVTATTEIPNTGAETYILFAPMATIAIGYFIARRYQIR